LKLQKVIYLNTNRNSTNTTESINNKCSILPGENITWCSSLSG